MAIVIVEGAPVLTPAAVASADPRDLMVFLVDPSPADIAAMDRCEAEAFTLACDRARAARRGSGGGGPRPG